MAVVAKLSIGSVEEQKYLSQLKQKLSICQVEFIKYVKDRLFFEEIDYTQKLQQLNQIYVKAVLNLCVVPLQNGVNPSSVLKTLDLWIGTCVFSSRTDCIDKFVKSKFLPVLQKQLEKQESTSSWVIRKNRIENLDSGAFLLYVPDAIACMEIAFCIQAYEQMRKMVDTEAAMSVLTKYMAAVQRLYTCVTDDTISDDLLRKHMRKITGVFVANNRDNARYFTELAYHQVIRGKDVQKVHKVVTKDGRKEIPYTVWTGHYLMVGTNTPFTNAFSPRLPISVNDLRKKMSAMWTTYMEKAQTPDEWADAVTSNDAFFEQLLYLYILQDDTSVKPEDLPFYKAGASEDESWMMDYQGEDPFHISGLNASYDDFLKTGPTDTYVAGEPGEFPEFKSAFGRWLNTHETWNPVYWQKEANVLYLTSDISNEETLNCIKRCFAKRDELRERWNQVFASIQDMMRVHMTARKK